MLLREETFTDSKLVERREPDLTAKAWLIYDGAGNLVATVAFTEEEKVAAITPASPDWKALWLAVDTAAKKVAVLAKRLELE